MESISIKHDGRRGRPRKRPRVLYADAKCNNMPLNGFYLDGKHVKARVPEASTKKQRPGRPSAFDKQAYNHIRSMIERFNGWIKAFTRVAPRFARLSQLYMGFVHLPCIMVYLRILQ